MRFRGGSASRAERGGFFIGPVRASGHRHGQGPRVVAGSAGVDCGGTDVYPANEWNHYTDGANVNGTNNNPAHSTHDGRHKPAAARPLAEMHGEET